MQLYYRQPTGFGAAASPRQDLRTGEAFKTWPEATMHLARIVHRTTREAMQTILPEGFTIEEGAEPTIMYEVMNLRNLPWLAGRGYNTCGVYVGNVVHTSSDSRGSFLAVLFESLCDPIITGREELGFPKVFADLRVEGDKYTLSWDKHDFMELDFHNVKEAEAPPLLEKKSYTHPMVDGNLAYRYMPAIGKPGTADAEYCVKMPAAKVAQHVRSYKKPESASLQIAKSTFEQLPTLHNIVNQLAAIPNLGIIESGIYDLQEASDCGRVSKVNVVRVNGH